MPPLNYHHLRYFWTVARLGSITKACAELHLTQPAVSAQLRTLERALGEKLLERRGRHLALTEIGRLVFGYADEIFTVGRELQETLAGRGSGRPIRFSVGVADTVPKLITQRLLQPALSLPDPVRLVLKEDRPERLLAELSQHTLDLVIADAPAPSAIRVKAFSHLLGESAVMFFAAPHLHARLARRFPASLSGAPWLAPPEGSELRRSLEGWFEATGWRPAMVAEIEDSAVLKTFGEHGTGVFAAPAVVADEVRRQYGVKTLGIADGLQERFFALSVERRLKHPAVLAISAAARADLFADPAPGRRRPRGRASGGSQ